MTFTVFQSLPTEIRLMIWERVPQPSRLVGQVPCLTCSRRYRRTEDRNTMRQYCISTNHPKWRLRFISQPSDEAVFPPLHACRESRNAWLPRYFRPPRYINLENHGYERDSQTPNGEVSRPSYSLRFDIPFISYETDVFAIFDAWAKGHVDITDEHLNPNELDLIFFDPFLGLDRTRIQQAAMGENAEHLASAVVNLDFHSLPRLHRLSVLSYGPAPQQSLANLRIEMRASEVQKYYCTVIKILPELVLSHPIFGEDRLRHPQFEPRPHIRRLSSYMALLKALIWHTAHTDLGPIRQESLNSILDFEDFAISPSELPGADNTHCPLQHVSGCGMSGHGFREMESWTPQFEMDNLMILCESPYTNDLFKDSYFLPPDGR